VTSLDMAQIQADMVYAARLAGDILRKNLGQAGRIDYKGEINLVTDTDRQAEEVILKTLQTHYPQWDILSEEIGQQGRGADSRFIIDPLDGTVNYAHNYPCFCVSIALEQHGEISLGVVYEPLRNELYTAVRNQGAYLNAYPIKVSKTSRLSKSLLVTGFPYDIWENQGHNLKYFNQLVLQAQGIRRDGAAALDLCYTAAGRFDGFWELGLGPWDVAAGSLIVTEAGGRVSHINDDFFALEKGQILASNGLIHNELRQALQAAEKKGEKEQKHVVRS
jgi:myo-inositol-1(or 4)-monophosphatase